jgi:hypothetical protein
LAVGKASKTKQSGTFSQQVEDHGNHRFEGSETNHGTLPAHLRKDEGPKVDMIYDLLNNHHFLFFFINVAQNI